MRKLRLGMVGGGSDSMIGNIHRCAARLDNFYELVAGVFSRDLKKSQQLNNELKLNPTRIYAKYQDMIEGELRLPKEKRIDVIAIVTPTYLHFEAVKACLAAGFHLIIDKPLCNTLQEANELLRLQQRHHNFICLTYTYAGYPMIKEMKSLIAKGELGNIFKINIRFQQGWLINQKQLPWRMDSSKSISCTTADIGTHAFYLAEYITGLKVISLKANLRQLLSHHPLDDDATITLHFSNHVVGIIHLSQVEQGEDVSITINVNGEHGSLNWQHASPNTLMLKRHAQVSQVLTAGTDNQYLSPLTRHNCRTPAGHPEGFIEAFANHYRNFALFIQANKAQIAIEETWKDYPTLIDGVRGMKFIETAINTSLQQIPMLINDDENPLYDVDDDVSYSSSDNR